jgi:hypothetical protein
MVFAAHLDLRHKHLVGVLPSSQIFTFTSSLHIYFPDRTFLLKMRRDSTMAHDVRHVLE